MRAWLHFRVEEWMETGGVRSLRTAPGCHFLVMRIGTLTLVPVFLPKTRR